MRKTLLACSAVLSLTAAAETVEFTEETGVLCNPGQGWSSMGRNAAKYEGVVNIGQVYDRPAWRDFEPQEGVYDWRKLDGFVAYAAKMGLPATFRIMCACSRASRPCTPDWVWEKGAKFDEWEEIGCDGNVHTNRAPIFDDETFLACHRRFVEKLAERYDGDPRLYGIDLGSYGNFGEWHCSGLPPNCPKALPRDAEGRIVRNAPRGKWVKPHVYPLEVRKRYVDMYLDNFRKTEIVFMTDDYECLAYALGTGTPRVGIRRDGVGSKWHYSRWIGHPPYDKIPVMGDVWKDRPVWFEFYGDFKKYFLKDGRDIGFAVNWMLTNHVSVVNTCPASPAVIKDDAEHFPLLRAIDLYAGARLVPQRCRVERDGRTVRISLEGINRGAAPVHIPYELRFAVVGADGKDAFSFTGKSNPSKWLPGPFAFEESCALPEGVRGRLVLRLVHRDGVFRNFRFAAKESLPDGTLPLTKEVP